MSKIVTAVHFKFAAENVLNEGTFDMMRLHTNNSSDILPLNVSYDTYEVFFIESDITPFSLQHTTVCDEPHRWHKQPPVVK